jgi:YidC/Oxa1 family membrane protein insertase
MEKRVLLAVILSFIVLYGYQALFPPPRPATQPGRAPQPSPAPSTPSGGTVQAPGPALETPASPAPGATALVSDSAEREIIVENSAVRAAFSTRGAVLTSWRLKNYRAADGQPLDLIPHRVSGAPRPFTLGTEDEALSATLRNALYKPSADDLNAEAAPATLTFEYRDSSGVSVRKEFGFDPRQPYIIAFTASVLRGEAAIVPTVIWGPALGTGVVGGGMT